MSPSPINIEPGTTLVVSHWEEVEGDAAPSTVRGVCTSVEEFYGLLKRLWIYDPEGSEGRLELRPYCEEDVRGTDPDLFATSRIVIVHGEEEVEETDFYVWDSSKSAGAYEPLKLYWAMTGGSEEDWFIVARSARDAAFEHAAAEGFDPEDPSAEYIMDIPPSLQRRLASADVCWPDHETLIECGAKFIREVSPRVVEIAGRTFTEGMMERLVEMARSGQRPESN